MRRGWTMVEFLVVVTVILVVASLVYPLARGMRKEALKRACVNNLRQIGGLVVAYREEWEGAGKYGLPWEMGLPVPIRKAVPKEEKKTYLECPIDPYSNMYSYFDMYPGNTPEEERDPREREFLKRRVPEWLKHVKRMKERSVIFICKNHYTPRSPYDRQYGIGLLLNGEVVERWGWTAPTEFSFWED
ncbi:MAG: prepilin-type N-terminal cleavage/methylation domain-containing protein [Fimbriimonadales bacterium]|nr:prepilin-type N-terminal cleavage/methylation domain-containing protein [Fimbriimonadales bacterium]